MKIKLLLILLVIILLSALLFAGQSYYRVYRLEQDFLSLGVSVNSRQSAKALEFLRALVGQVLQEDSSLNFTDQLRLETLVREIDDKETLIIWQELTASETDVIAQKNIIALLKKLSYLIKSI